MKQLFSLALAACLPLAAHAGPPAPQDAQASAPPVVYRSAFDAYQPVREDEATPDETWRALNGKVGDAGGHRGHMMKDPEMTMKTPMKMPIAKPAEPEAPAAQQHQHRGH